MRALWALAFILSCGVGAITQSRAQKLGNTVPSTDTVNPPCNPAMRHDLAQEIADTNKEFGGMTARATMLRSNAGIVQDSAARSALQIDSDLWLSLIASMRRRVDRLQSVLDSCDSGKKAPVSGDIPERQ